MKAKYKFTIGTDPEFMIGNGTSVVSAIPLVAGNKEDKSDLGDGFLCFHDNVLLETNILPGSDKKEVISNIRTGITKIATFIGGSYELLARASHDFTPEECEHPDARIVGCSVEYDAYTASECKPPSFQSTKRSAGGHIHLGRSDYKDFVYLDEDGYTCYHDGVDPTGEVLIDMNSKIEIVRLMDIFVGLPLTVIDKDPTSPARKTLYGKAGRCRPCPYGVEYRTPPNYWLTSPKLVDLVYDLAIHVLNIAKDGLGAGILAEFNAEHVQKAINDNDSELAKQLIEMAFVDAPELLARIEDASTMEFKSLYSEWSLA